MALVRIGWRENGDGLDVALAAGRALAHGRAAWWLDDGDYLVEAGPLPPGLRTAPADAPAGAALVASRAALFCGPATGYPYWGYYALCLARLGIGFDCVDGKAMAAGALDRANLLVIPGGFATWNFDRAEDAPGADAEVRRFLASGGRAIGSCGGAYYLSAGRPGWTGTAATMPLYTHEYLQSGVGVVSLALAPGGLARGLPPGIDMPYYHGPIWTGPASNAAVAATFADLVLPGRLGIDNPLDHERFARDMKGRPAILDASGARGEAVLFSPHPEMGDLLRKYIALDGYARRYLPVRGLPVLRDTMRFYAPADSPSFRLVAYAAHDLVTRPGTRCVDPMPMPAAAPAPPPDPRDALGAMLARVDPAGDPDIAPLLDFVADELRARLARAPWPVAGAWAPAAAAVAEAIVARAPALAAAPVAQLLLEAELGIALLETLARAADTDRSMENP
ncbi:MAG: hypothetical protein ACKOGH_14935 [Alphaproteobacteria bacterium]